MAVAAVSAPKGIAGRALGNRSLMAGLAILGLIILMAVLAPWISPFDPNDQDPVLSLGAPSAQHWFGTDFFGRDVLSRVIWGARVSLFVGAVSTALSMVVGGAIGIVSGYLGGRFDQTVMAVMDVLLSFPQLIMGLIIVALLGANLADLILAIAITAVPPFARVARGPTLSLKERDFIEAGRALGFSNARIMLVHILPNVLDELVVMGSLWLATAIRTEASLSFIGLGLPPPTATWGGIIREGFENLLDAPWLAVFPSLAVLVVMMALNMIGDGLRDATDPKAAAS
ncbi:diguanylate cyclase [Aliidongia dinghuensis]|uniref:Diguanylate cyclase n=1 Tax=Aliidongia dinghuensis TaxID=1867774 RepID=A0A8J2YWP7_9PROT|nr:ABC transporter permease [Aliidongia dinghuensis]GGF26680.1 diguanylate cyclase [Aliidongia dinghuensis]